MHINYFKTFCYVTLINPYSTIIKVTQADIRNCLSLNRKLNFSSSVTSPPWRIIFFGTDEFALKCVQPLCAKLRTGTLLSNVTVVARPGSVVRKFAQSEKLPIIEWPLSHDDIKDKFDLGVVVSFGHLISEKTISAIPLGILNVHGSLLPRWRGAAPIIYAIKHADPETGVTIMKIEPHRFDTGSIVRQYRCHVDPDETTPQLTARLAEQGARLLMECVRDLPRCLELATPQPEAGVTYAPRVTMEQSEVDWSTMGARTVYNLQRAISHVYALTTSWHGAQTRLLNITIDSATAKWEHESDKGGSAKWEYESDKGGSSVSALNFLNSTTEPNTTPRYFIDTTNNKPGTIFYNKLNRTMRILCADGCCVTCGGIRMGGKNFISPHDFNNGYLTKVDKSQWYFS